MRKPGTNEYFGREVEQGIIEFNQTRDDALFTSTIYPALSKLIENVIHNMKFYEYDDDSYTTIKHTIITYLYVRLGGYTEDRGKAFSYFNRIVINWVLAYRNKLMRDKRNVGLDHVDLERDITGELSLSDRQDELEDFCHKWSLWGIENSSLLFDRKKDAKISESLFNIIKNCRAIDNYNKKALYMMVREQCDVKTQDITDVLNVLKPLQREMFVEYQNSGTRKWKYFLTKD